MEKKRKRKKNMSGRRECWRIPSSDTILRTLVVTMVANSSASHWGERGGGGKVGWKKKKKKKQKKLQERFKLQGKNLRLDDNKGFNSLFKRVFEKNNRTKGV